MILCHRLDSTGPAQGKPLMAWAIENGVKSKYITRTFVSTDSEEYRQVAMKHGAEVPFLRPAEISHDTATDSTAPWCRVFIRGLGVWRIGLSKGL